jgi:sigma-B regulation protein RsbU (phosphoserine phosphatase)
MTEIVSPPTHEVATDSPSTQIALCDCLKLDRFQVMRRLFAELSGLDMTLVDHDGRPIEGLTAPTCQQAAPVPLSTEVDDAGRRRYTAPIAVGDRVLGAVRITPTSDVEPSWAGATDEAAAAALLYQWAASVAQACYQEHQLSNRVEELSVLYDLSTLLAGQRDLQQVLDAAAKAIVDVMKVKASSIRLVSEDGRELVPMAVCNLSDAYINKGPVLIEDAELSQRALAGEVIYVEDMTNDPHIVYADDAKREGLVSSLFCGMVYQGRKIGTIRAYSGEKRTFTAFEMRLLQAIGQLMAAAIVNAYFYNHYQEARHVQRQLRLAGEVQRRMLPSTMPHLPPFDIAAEYVPTLELGGDFYDFIGLDGHLGIALGDVVGKGVAASLLMSSVRASLRAYAQDVYDIDEIIARVNIALTRDTLDNEFATLFYGVIDPATRRITYCNAGHEPPLLLRGDKLIKLEAGGMIVGIDSTQEYDKGMIDLMPGDMLLIYSDGLSEAQDFNGKQFGRQRIIDAMKQAAVMPTATVALHHILWQMRCFTGLQHNIDDTTTVLIKVGNSPAPPAQAR